MRLVTDLGFQIILPAVAEDLAVGVSLCLLEINSCLNRCAPPIRQFAETVGHIF